MITYTAQEGVCGTVVNYRGYSTFLQLPCGAPGDVPRPAWTNANNDRALFICPTTRNSERKGREREQGCGGESIAHVERFKVCADLGGEMLAALIIGWRPTSGASAWGTVRKTKVQLTGPQTEKKSQANI